MIQVDTSLLKPLFKNVEDLDGNGVISSGDRIVTDKDAYTVTESYVEDLSKLSVFLTNISDRRFRLLTDSNDYMSSHYYLAYSAKGNFAKLEGLANLGYTREVADGEDSYIEYRDEQDSLVNLAQSYSTLHFTGRSAKRFTKLAAEYDSVMSDIHANWTQRFQLASLGRRLELATKLTRLLSQAD